MWHSRKSYFIYTFYEFIEKISEVWLYVHLDEDIVNKFG